MCMCEEEGDLTSDPHVCVKAHVPITFCSLRSHSRTPSRTLFNPTAVLVPMHGELHHKLRRRRICSQHPEVPCQRDGGLHGNKEVVRGVSPTF